MGLKGFFLANRSKYTIKNTLANFIKDYIDPIRHIDENIITIPQLSQVVGIDLSNWILNNLKDIINDNEAGYAIVGLEAGFGTVMLHKTDIINKIVISDVVQMDDSTITCKILIDAKLIMYISGDQDDFIVQNLGLNFLNITQVKVMWMFPHGNRQLQY